MKREEENMQDCPSYDSCSASICPLDENSYSAIWFPDEDICKRRFKDCPEFIQRQRKIKKQCQKKNHCFYFTREMLEHRCIITKNIKGLNPDIKQSREKQSEKWFADHKEYKPTEKQIKNAQQLGSKKSY